MFVTSPAANKSPQPVDEPAAVLGFPGYVRRVLRWPGLVSHLVKGVVLSRSLGRPSDALRVAKWQADLLRCCGVELVVKGQPSEEPCLWVSNHISWLDAPVLGSLASTVFVAKHEVSEWPVIGDLVKGGGTIFIKRGANQANAVRDEMVGCLNAGRSVVVFPEATTTRGDRVSYLFPRLMSAALLADVPVQPVTVDYGLGSRGQQLAPYVDDMRFLPHLKGLLSEKKLVCTVEFLPLIDEPTSRDALASKVRQVLAHNLQLPAGQRQKNDINLAELVQFLKSRHGI